MTTKREVGLVGREVSTLRTEGARRDHAERYLFVVIAGFAVSVAATHWFLATTGTAE